MAKKVNALTPEEQAEKLVKKRDDFVRLVEYRVNRLLKNLDQLGNLANKQSYAYEQADIDKVMSTIHRAYESLQTRFAKGKPDVVEWTLD